MKFSVDITRTVNQTLAVEVDANFHKEAEEKAMETAGSLDFRGREQDAEYSCHAYVMKITEVDCESKAGRIIAAFQPQVWVNDNANDDGPLRYFDVTEVVVERGQQKTLAVARSIQESVTVKGVDRDFVDNLVFDNATGLLPLGEPHTGCVDPEDIARQIIDFWK